MVDTFYFDDMFKLKYYSEVKQKSFEKTPSRRHCQRHQSCRWLKFSAQAYGNDPSSPSHLQAPESALSQFSVGVLQQELQQNDGIPVSFRGVVRVGCLA